MVTKKSRILIALLLVAASFVLEMRLEAFGIRPNLTVLLVYYAGLRYGAGRGALFGASIGIIADSLSGHLLGPNLLSKGTAAILASAMTGGFLRWTPVLGAIGLFAVTCTDGIISLAALSIFAEVSADTAIAAKTILAQATVNAILGVFLKPSDEY